MPKTIPNVPPLFYVEGIAKDGNTPISGGPFPSPVSPDVTLEDYVSTLLTMNEVATVNVMRWTTYVQLEAAAEKISKIEEPDCRNVWDREGINRYRTVSLYPGPVASSDDVIETGSKLLWRGPLQNFAESNSLDDDEIKHLWETISAGRVYIGGGGAQPTWRITG